MRTVWSLLVCTVFCAASMTPIGCNDESSSTAGAAGASGASSAGGSSGSASSGGNASSVCTDSNPMDYSPGTTVISEKSLYSVKLKSVDPPRILRGTNDWVVEITDKSGSAVNSATVAVKPFMPAHGHSSATVPTVTEKGDGAYQIDSVVLSMPGTWEITLTITSENQTDSAVFHFCVEG